MLFCNQWNLPEINCLEGLDMFKNLKFAGAPGWVKMYIIFMGSRYGYVKNGSLASPPYNYVASQVV